jgi:hypothetical protein
MPGGGIAQTSIEYGSNHTRQRQPFGCKRQPSAFESQKAVLRICRRSGTSCAYQSAAKPKPCPAAARSTDGSGLLGALRPGGEAVVGKASRCLSNWRRTLTKFGRLSCSSPPRGSRRGWRRGRRSTVSCAAACEFRQPRASPAGTSNCCRRDRPGSPSCRTCCPS